MSAATSTGAPPASTFGARAEDLVGRSVPGAARVLDARARHRRDRWLEREMSYQPAKFQVVDTLSR